MWGPPISGRRLRIGTSSGREGERAMGQKLAWARVLPRGIFNFFPFSFSFLFCFLLIFGLKLANNF
jgi:hypothetical protein